MKFNIVDTERIYRELLAIRDTAMLEDRFAQSLIAPMAGRVRFFGGDGPALFRQWGSYPEQFTGENAVQMRQIVDTLAKHRAWDKAEQALDTGIQAFGTFLNRIPLSEITFGLYVVDMRNVPFQRGYSGFGAIPGWIMTVYGTPNAYNLQRIQAATAHELHHNLLASTLPQGQMIASVADYLVCEGLAESFAESLYGEDTLGYFVTDFEMDRFEETRQKIGAALNVSGFNEVRGYIFGDIMTGINGIKAFGLPPFAGYAMGYYTVQAYLKRTGKTVVEATFIPARELIAESGVFEPTHIGRLV